MANYLTVKVLHNFLLLPLPTPTCCDHQARFSWDDLPPLGVCPGVHTKAFNTQKILRWGISYGITFQVREGGDQESYNPWGTLYTCQTGRLGLWCSLCKDWVAVGGQHAVQSLQRLGI